MNPVDGIGAALADAGLRLGKAVPRAGNLLVEATSADGPEAGVRAGRWFPDPAAARAFADRLGPARARTLAVPAGGRLVLQLGGADDRLPALAGLLERPGNRLVAHRSGRRAVIREPAGYLKVVRPGRAGDVARGLAGPNPDEVRVPRVRSVDESTGVVAMSALPGTTLHRRLLDPVVDDGDLAADLRSVGRALRCWHAAAPRSAAPRSAAPRSAAARHDPAAEVAVTLRWLRTATRFGLLSERAWRPRLADALARLDRDRPASWVRAHRDLHDKQLLLAPGEPIGLLDLDLAAVAEPALDLANLLVHLELRVRQGLSPADRAAAAGQALLDGYRPDPGTRRRIPAYAGLTRLRLAAVYAFRPTRSGLTEELLAGARPARRPIPE